MELILEQGAEFDKLEQLKQACQLYSIHNAFEFKTKQSSKTRYEIVCKNQNCSWRLYAIALGGTANIFHIRTYASEHQCFGLAHRTHNAATSAFIANVISEKLKEQPEYGPRDIQCDIQCDFSVKIPYSTAFRGKEVPNSKIHGSFENTYKPLP